MPFFEVDIPPGRLRSPVEEALLLKQRTKSKYFPSSLIQFVGPCIIGGDGDDDRFAPMGGQLDVRVEHLRSGALSEIMQSSGYCSGVVEDVVTVDIGRGALETLCGAPFEEFVLVD